MFFTISFGYFVLLLCLSELVGIVPFSGGNFGFVRCALGPFWGYLAACMEFLYYSMYNARSLLKVSLLVQQAGDFNPDIQPVWALITLAVVVLVNIRGGLTFWSLMMFATLFTLAILMIFFVGAYSHVDFKAYALGYHYTEEKYHNDGFVGNGQRYLSYIIRIAVFYLGLDILPLCSLRVVDESRVIPRALMTSFGIMFVISILAVFAVACHYPGVHPKLANTLFVLQYGLEDATNMNPKWYPLLLIVPTLASTTGYLFAAGNQLAAMAESGLVSKLLRPRVGEDQIPVVAILTCGLIQYVVYFLLHHFEPNLIIFASNIWFIAAPGLFMFVCLAFIAFRIKFTNMKRNFVSPFGLFGGIYGALCWFFIGVVNSDHRFQPNTKAIKAFYIFMSIMIVYYFAYVRKVQCFSKEEQDKFMKVYILNANRLRNKSYLFRTWSNFWRRSGTTAIRSSVGSNYSNSNNSSSISSNREVEIVKDSNLTTFATSLDHSAAGTPPEIEMGVTVYRAEAVEISQSITLVRHRHPQSDLDDELVSVENRAEWIDSSPA